MILILMLVKAKNFSPGKQTFAFGIELWVQLQRVCLHALIKKP